MEGKIFILGREFWPTTHGPLPCLPSMYDRKLNKVAVREEVRWNSHVSTCRPFGLCLDTPGRIFCMAHKSGFPSSMGLVRFKPYITPYIKILIACPRCWNSGLYLELLHFVSRGWFLSTMGLRLGGIRLIYLGEWVSLGEWVYLGECVSLVGQPRGLMTQRKLCLCHTLGMIR